MSTSFSRRSSGSARGRTAAAEANENEIRNPVDPIAAPPPRSPLVSIQDPSQNPTTTDQLNKVAGATLKSAPATPVRLNSRGFAGNGSSAASNAGYLGHYAGGKEKSSLFSSRISRETADANASVPVDIPYFELNDDPNFWKDHNVQVLIRFRPVSEAEVALQGYRRCLVQENSQTLVWNGHPETRFTFDHVACESMSQEKLFRVLGLPMVENCMSGYNSCMFAYGQTGSGKTYTMMGEIQKTDNILSEDCGITPRIFEYLFARIKEEEDSKSSEKLRYSCKCSFLEIYNEQITDLLEPSSTNLQLREDIEKGVYVENLKEYQVSSVRDVIELLLQGASNRKMAATHMNSESSRSHSVFTCVIESRWERDSMSHLRYGRLNLVDLAGSERQKSSGAEGERLKEAANINRSLSTLGLVIMTLVDIANGKHRHVPYRDSRLTFLLQDSLGGNSKTTIVANVSPSICSASETLSTLKFAQRAKLIQNNAKVNEDASGDVTSLQRQIQKLKEQLTLLIKYQSIPRSPCSTSPFPECGSSIDLCNSFISSRRSTLDALDKPCDLSQKIKYLEEALSEALRREKMAEAEIRRLEAEIEHMNLLKEDDARRTKVTLSLNNQKFRISKLLANGKMGSDGDLVEEATSSSQNIQLLPGRINANSDITQFSQENMRLLEHLKMFQRCYQPEKNDLTLTEVSCSRNQGDDSIKPSSNSECLVKTKESKNLQSTPEPQNLKQVNYEHLEIVEMVDDWMNLAEQNGLGTQTTEQHGTAKQSVHPCIRLQGITDTPEFGFLENLNLQHQNLEETNLVNTRLKDNNSVQNIWESENEEIEKQVEVKGLRAQEQIAAIQQEVDQRSKSDFHVYDNSLLGLANKELNDQMCVLIQENMRLSELVSSRDADICAVSDGWEKAITDLTQFLIDGCKSLDDAFKYINTLVESLPQGCLRINGHLERAIKVFIEKELVISDLQKRLDIATQVGLGMKLKMDSLRGATLAITEVQQLENEENFEELCFLKKLVAEKNQKINELEVLLKSTESRTVEAEKCADAAFSVTKKLYELNALKPLDLGEIKSMIQCTLNEKSSEQNTQCERAYNPAEPEGQISNVDSLHSHKLKTPEHIFSLTAKDTTVRDQEAEHKALSASCIDVQKYMSDLISDIDMTFSAVRLLFNTSMNEVRGMTDKIKELKKQVPLLPSNTFHFPTIHAHVSESRPSIKQNVADSLVEIAKTLSGIEFVLDSSLRIPTGSSLHQHENTRMGAQFANMVTICDQQEQHIDDQGYDNELMNNLKHDIRLALSMLTEVQLQFCMLFKSSHTATSCAKRICSKEDSIMPDTWDKITSNNVSAVKEQHSEKKVREADLGCYKTEKIDELQTDCSSQEVQEKQFQENEFLMKFEQAQETMAEAEHVLEALLKAHDTVKSERDMWRKVSKEETAEKLMLLEEVRNLQAFNCAEKQYQTYHDQVAETLVEILEQTSLVERSFQCTKRIISKEMNAIHFDISSFGQECLKWIETSRSSLKGMLSAISPKDKSRRTTNQVLKDDASLNREVARKDEIINGLLFDIRILQESTSNVQDMKEKMEEMAAALSQLDNDLRKRTSQLDTALSDQKVLEEELAKSEDMLSSARFEMEHAKKLCVILSQENCELRLLLEAEHTKSTQMEELLDERKKVIDGLEKEILSTNSFIEGGRIFTVKKLMDEIKRVSKDRDDLQKELMYLNDKLEMAMTLVDEKEAIAVEVRQVAEANRVHAEEKEEEVKILEYSVQELEGTIDVLEKKVSDMKEKVESHQLTRKHLEHEVQVLKERIHTAENVVEQLIRHESVQGGGCTTLRPMDDKIRELCEARRRVEELEMESAHKEEEIKQQQKYISELVLHSEAQSSLYQLKFKALGEMLSDVKNDGAVFYSSIANVSKMEKNTARTRGSSPFRCISTLVQQMHLEKEHELSLARHQIEELEALASNRQKEICQLTARIAAVDGMTHDVIRDLLGIKLDLTKYSNLIDKEELPNLLAKAHQSMQEINAKDMEILTLKKQICSLIEERESLAEEISQRRKDLLDNQMMLEQLQQRDQLVTAQNEILKMDKANLQRKISGIEKRLKLLVGSERVQDNLQQPTEPMDFSSTSVIRSYAER